MKGHRSITALLYVLMVGAVGDVWAADKFWDGGGGNARWTTANNWLSNGEPTSGDDVYFNNTYVGTLPASLELRGSQVANSLTFDTGDTLTLVNGTGSRTLTLTSGAVTRTAGSSGNQALNFTTLSRSGTGDFTFDLNGTGSFSVGAVITGTNNTLTKQGDGLLILGSNNTYTGASTISGGILRITNASALGTTAVGTTVQSGGELQLSGGLTVTGELLTLAGGGTNGALVNQSGNNTWNADITLAADATITNLDAGLMSVGQYNASPASNADLILGGNTVTFNSASTGGLRVASDIVGTGNVIIASTGSGVVEYYSTGNTFTGTTTVNSGTLSLYMDNAGASNFVVGDGTGVDTLTYNALNDQIGDSSTVRVNRSGVFDLNNRSDTIGALTLEAGIGGGTGLVATGGGTLTVTGDVTLAHHTAGTDSAEISGNLNLGGGTRVFDIADSAPDVDLLVSAVISEPFYSSINKQGDGTLHLTGANTYTGETNVNAGVLRAGSATALGTANFNNTVAGGAAIEFAGNFTLNESGLTIAGTGIGGNGALRSISGTNAYDGQLALDAAGSSVGVDAGADLSLGGQINGGTFTKVGDGTLTLTGSQAVNASSFVVDGGTVVLNRTANSNLLNTAATINSGTLRLAANQQIADYTTVTIAPAGTLDLDGHNETLTALAMTGGAMTTGSGTLTLTGNPAITSSAHTTAATVDGNLALTAHTATFEVADGAAVIDLDIGAAISGAAILNKTGLGTVRLGNAANSYTGGTLINAGTVLIAPGSGNVGFGTAGSNSFLGHGAITVNTGGTLDIAPTASGSDFTGFNRALTIDGGTVRLGPQDQITNLMQGANTLTFGTNGGTLDIATRLNNNVNLGNVQVDAGVSTPAVIRYGTIASTSGDGGWNSGTRDLNVQNGSLSGTGHLQFQLTDGAAVEYNQAAFGGTLYFAGPSSGDAGTGSTGTATGRLALNSASTLTAAGGVNFDGIMQVTTYNAARTLDADITIRSGTTAFQGRGTNSGALDDLTLGASVNGRTLTINDGARAVMDIGFRDSNSHNGGVVLNATTDIAAGGTLQFRQSYSANTYDQIDVYGNIIGRGTTANEALVLLDTPVGDLPGTLAGSTRFAAGSNLIVNGAGAGGLRLEGTQARVDALATDARLAATTGTGGTLTLAYTDGGDRTIGGGANLTVASAVNLGLESSGGEFTLNGDLSNWGGLVVGTGTTVSFGSSSVFGSGDAITLQTGATLNLDGTTQSFGDMLVLGDAIIDFGGTSIFNVDSLDIASGATLTITGWTESIDYFYSLVSPDAASLSQITFAGAPEGPGSKWQSFDNQITPVPEPSTYGLLVVGGVVGLTLCRRRRQRR